MKTKNVKGCYDFLPKEQKVRNYINRILKETFEQYGYLPIETPILNYYDMLSDKYDEENDILKEIYQLSDQGLRKLGLRYDLTVPFAKFIALNKNNIKLPFKRYEIAKVFRDGPVKVGRDREFTQCDVDVVGLSGQEIEIELLSLYISAFNKMNIPITIKYNSRNLMRGIVEELVEEKEKVPTIITIIDKIEKITKDEFIKELEKLGISQESALKLLKYFKLNLKEITKELENSTNKLIKKGLKELNNLEKLISKQKFDKYCSYTPSLARGQEYYTGNVFEVYDKSGKLTSSIGGGGRYDNMITEFINDGEEYPAVGVSFGLTSLYELLKDREEFNNISNIDIYVIPIETFSFSFSIANQLRQLNLKVLLELQEKKLKKCLDFANKEKIKYTIIIGEDEVKNNEIVIKNMFSKEKYNLKLEELNKIKEVINI